jgi:ribosome maturation factor RimP
MSRNPLQARLISIIEPVCKAGGLELVDVRYTLEQGGWTLRVAVDLPLPADANLGDVPEERVDLSRCEELSRELSAVLDVDDPIPQAYSLEVSSPGIDRPLRTAAHFAHFVGSEAKLQLAIPMQTATGERRNFRGTLRGVAGEPGHERIAIDCDGQPFELALADLDNAKLVPDWDAVMRGRSGVGAPEPKPIKPGHRPSQKPKPPKHKEQG